MAHNFFFLFANKGDDGNDLELVWSDSVTASSIHNVILPGKNCGHAYNKIYVHVKYILTLHQVQVYIHNYV